MFSLLGGRLEPHKHAIVLPNVLPYDQYKIGVLFYLILHVWLSEHPLL